MEGPGKPRKPWYREPWPWVAIAIPAAAVIMGVTTLVIAITNPDPLTVDERTYQDLRSDLAADPSRTDTEPAADSSADPDDGAH